MIIPTVRLECEETFEMLLRARRIGGRDFGNDGFAGTR
jgi:hypothetical protein